MDTESKKMWLNQDDDMKFMSLYYPHAIQRLLDELHAYSQRIIDS